MGNRGKYVYGIINTNKELFFGPFGITAREDVYTVPYQDISAIVSDSEIVDYTHMPKDALARLLIKHQKVIEKIMSFGHSIIPMRLGTFAVDEAELKNILHKAYSLIDDIWPKICDKIEIDIVVLWGDFNSVLKEVSEEKEIKEFKETLLANHEGISVDDQMKVGVMVKKALDKKRDDCVFQIQDALKTVSQNSKVHELMDDKMIMNTAFLINKIQHEDFDKIVEELNTKFNEGLNFRCVGPLPPYSFYTLQIKKMDFKEVDWARKRLGLSDITTKEEIKKAHRKLAFSLHPDKNPDTLDIEKEFDDATRAYKILIDYSLAAKQAGQGDNSSFNESEFKKNAILVKVRE